MFLCVSRSRTRSFPCAFFCLCHAFWSAWPNMLSLGMINIEIVNKTAYFWRDQSQSRHHNTPWRAARKAKQRWCGCHVRERERCMGWRERGQNTDKGTLFARPLGNKIVWPLNILPFCTAFVPISESHPLRLHLSVYTNLTLGLCLVPCGNQIQLLNASQPMVHIIGKLCATRTKL